MDWSETSKPSWFKYFTVLILFLFSLVAVPDPVSFDHFDELGPQVAFADEEDEEFEDEDEELEGEEEDEAEGEGEEGEGESEEEDLSYLYDIGPAKEQKN